MSGFGVVLALSQFISGFWVFYSPVVFCNCVPSSLYSSATDVLHLSATSKLKLSPRILMQLSS